MEKYVLIMCIVNSGFSDIAMDAAREAGARGGTIINARGTAKAEAEKMFNISIHPEKEMIMIVVEDNLKDDILHKLYQTCGSQSEAQGIALAMPIDDVVGLKPSNKDKKEES